jgi:hypothetical protein
VDRVNVLHTSYRLPYARKLRCAEFAPVNGMVSAGVRVPREPSARWIIDHLDTKSFDVLHLHSVDRFLESELTDIITECAIQRTGLVFTVHDLVSMSGAPAPEYAAKIALLCRSGAELVFLTAGSRESAARTWTLPDSGRVIPHGGVLPLDHPAWQAPRRPLSKPVFAMYGNGRANRAYRLCALNWLFGLADSCDSELRILMRAVAESDLDGPDREIADLTTIAMHGRHRGLRLRLRPFVSDSDIIEFLRTTSILVLPYRFGTHSGQLELAFDLGLVPVITNVGHYAEQWQRVAAHVPRPLFVNWTDGNADAYGQRLLGAMWQATSATRPTRPADLHEFRRAESREILASYAKVYARARSAY